MLNFKTEEQIHLKKISQDKDLCFVNEWSTDKQGF